MTETHSVKGRSHTMPYKYLLPHVPGVLLGITNGHLSLLILRSPWTPERRALPIKAQNGSLEEQLWNSSNQMVHIKKNQNDCGQVLTTERMAADAWGCLLDAPHKTTHYLSTHHGSASPWRHPLDLHPQIKPVSGWIGIPHKSLC